jgi:hypothetical protein
MTSTGVENRRAEKVNFCAGKHAPLITRHNLGTTLELAMTAVRELKSLIFRHNFFARRACKLPNLETTAKIPLRFIRHPAINLSSSEFCFSPTRENTQK